MLTKDQLKIAISFGREQRGIGNRGTRTPTQSAKAFARHCRNPSAATRKNQSPLRLARPRIPFPQALSMC